MAVAAPAALPDEPEVLPAQAPVSAHRLFLFRVLLAFQCFTFMAFSVHARENALLRYARQPLLFALLLWVLTRPRNTVLPIGSSTRIWVFLFGLLAVYLGPNVVLSVAPLNSLNYALWLIATAALVYQLTQRATSARSVRTDVHSIALALFYSGLLVGLVSYFGGFVLGIEDYFDERINFTLGRAVAEFGGVFGSANMFGIVLFQALCMLLVISVLKPDVSPALRLGRRLVGLALIIALIHVGNRSSMACTALAFACYLIFYRRNLLLPVLLAVVGWFTVELFPDFFAAKLRADQFQGNRRFGNRTELIEEGLEVIEKMDVTGLGYNNQRVARNHLLLEKDTYTTLHFHNTYLAVIIELGFIGMALFLALILLPIAVAALTQLTANPHRRLIVLLGCCIFPMLPTHIATEDSINLPGSPTFVYFWLLSLLILLLADNPQAPYAEPEPETPDPQS